MDSPTIATPRLLLRPHRVTDFEDLAALWGDAEVNRWIGGRPSTREESWARLLRYGGLWPMLGFGYFAITDRASGAFLGDVGLADFRRAITPSLEGFAEAGWVLAPQAWGSGIATEALVALLDWYGAQPARRPVACIVAPMTPGCSRWISPTNDTCRAKETGCAGRSSPSCRRDCARSAPSRSPT
ncbi:GNAT family N-acetyltransferase [Leptolyngbya sp. 15MV]|nr:GNAT family N-acetyltransferase [Leptolyngbya sp. 15MV]